MDCRCVWNERTRMWSVSARCGKAWRVIGQARRVNVRDAKFVARAGKGSVEGWLEGATWDDVKLPERADYVTWLKSDRTYYQRGLAAGDVVEFRDGWSNHGPDDFSARPVEPIAFAHMAVLTATAGRHGPKVRAFDPCHMPA